MKTADVVIVGAGPTGLALGVDLARRGVDALVLEKADALFPGSRGKGLQPRTMEVLEDLGVLDAILAAGGPYPVGMIWRDGERVGEHVMLDPEEFRNAAGDSAFTQPWMVPQWRTQEILFERLVGLGGRVDFGHEVTGLDQDATGVTLHLASGPDVRARYVVAADGGRSAVRRALGIGMTGAEGAPGGANPAAGEVDPNPVLVSDVRITGLDRDNWHVFPPGGEGDGHLAICPLAGTEDFQLVAQFPEGTVPDTSLDGIRKVAATRSHLAPEDITEVRWASVFRPRAALADRFRSGRVLLAGDAAHVHSPAGGQGLNTSVQDAYNLGWKLGAVLADGADPALLDTYEEERRPIAAQMLAISTGVHRGEVRRGAATMQLGLGYRESTLTEETRPAADTPRAGDRAPDARPAGVRLFDAFRGPHWTLLALGTEAPALDTRSIHVVQAPPQQPYGQGLFLVRPDGYIGWAGDSTAGLAGYIGRFGARPGA